MLAPTLFTICWFVNIQQRGEPASKEDVRSHPIWQFIREIKIDFVEDLSDPRQFCIIKDRVCLADYGNNLLESLLDYIQDKK
ncbi:MAG: hypothetical protein AAB614_00775 [Patescibacteria group bacterium]